PVGIGELDLDALAEWLELQTRGADRDLRARLDVDVVDAQARDVRAVRRVEVAQTIAAIVDADLAVQAGDLGVGELDIVAAPRADANDRGLDVAHEPRIGATRHFDAAAPKSRAGRASADVSDPGTRAQVIDRHAAGTLPHRPDSR